MVVLESLHHFTQEGRKKLQVHVKNGCLSPHHGLLGLPVLSQILTDAPHKYVKENYS